MKAAIYARKSTDDNDKNEDNKSVKRQVERARAFAAKHGWTVDEEHVYVDDGISGADFANRRRFHRLQEAAARGEFEVVVASEPSRLGRSGLADVQRLTDILESGIRVFYYLDDKEEKCDTFEGELHLTMQALFAKQERLRAAQRARDACARKAEAGYNAGGRVYGYDNRQVWTTNAKGEQARSHTEYRINDREADVIRRIYRAYAEGHGVVTIAKALNGDPRPAARLKRYLDGQTPPSPWKGTGSWAPSSVRAILHNVRYTGVIPYGKHRKVYKQGTKKRVKQAEYLTIPAPHLRIVDDKLWRAVQERHAAARKTYLRDTGGKLWGRPGMGAESKYLFTGLAHCGVCDSNIAVLGRPSGGRRLFYYGCSYHNNRGPTVCANDHRARMEPMNESVIAAIEEQALSPAIIAHAVERAAAQVAETLRANPDRPRELEAELKKLRREVGNLTRAIAGGQAPKTVLAEIATREAQIEALEKELAALGAIEPTEIDLRRLRKAAEGRVGRFRDLLHEDVPLARQALRKLLAEPIAFNPVVVDGRKTYAFKGKTRAGILLDPFYLEVASPGGFEPPLPP